MTTSSHSRVLLFGKLKQYAIGDELRVVTHPEMTPKEFRAAVAEELHRRCPEFPGVAELMSSAVATDRVLSEREQLGSSPEYSLLPPVCGG
ncbi:MAG: hypothetical protein H6617_05695 [Bdellovibrionaceae bacterium]|nr:hypothetical protein [Pseudobdellovibrionaceae bacterium]